jgi:hypothetical protein
MATASARKRKDKIRNTQRALNAFTGRYLVGVTPLRVDGAKGHATNSRIMAAKYYLGYGKHRDGDVKPLFLRRVRHPHSGVWATRGMRRTGEERRRVQRARETHHHFTATATRGVVLFDGKPCAEWIAYELQRIRDGGRWKGVLVSGWRDPGYSEGLCQDMCGAAQCPGRCAGRSSNHSGVLKPAGAADVTDYAKFRAECQRLHSPLHNELPNDPVHFSATGR